MVVFCVVIYMQCLSSYLTSYFMFADVSAHILLLYNTIFVMYVYMFFSLFYLTP
jgi:hypothetical protein